MHARADVLVVGGGPAVLDGLLAPGLHLSCDATCHSFLRKTPQCWLTGDGAGITAAMMRQGAVSRRV